uniref:Uncharacterized protein n=1 Tax=Lygus hesperus TaxID=30085 RepID=A0A146L5B5_LYGHE
MYLKSFVFALIVATGFGSTFVDYEAQSELARLKNLMKAFLKWAVKEESWERQKNMMSPNMKNTRLNSTFLDSDFKVTYLTFDNIKKDKKVVDFFRIDPNTLATSFRIRIPNVRETYRYKIAGTILSHKVIGEGLLTYFASNISMAASDLKFHDSPHNLQIASMKLTGYIDNLIIKISGLRVNGMKINAFEKVLQARILTMMKEKLNYSKTEVTQIESELDLLMYGKSLEELVRWLKKQAEGLTMNNMFQMIFSEH